MTTREKLQEEIKELKTRFTGEALEREIDFVVNKYLDLYDDWSQKW